MNVSKSIITLLAIFSTMTFAQIPPGQWMCYAFDTNNKSYEGMGDSVKTAMKDAKKNCFDRPSWWRLCPAVAALLPRNNKSEHILLRSHCYSPASNVDCLRN